MNKSGEISATFMPLGAVMPGRLISARARSLHNPALMSALGH